MCVRPQKRRALQAARDDTTPHESGVEPKEMRKRKTPTSRAKVRSSHQAPRENESVAPRFMTSPVCASNNRSREKVHARVEDSTCKRVDGLLAPFDPRTFGEIARPRP